MSTDKAETTEETRAMYQPSLKRVPARIARMVSIAAARTAIARPRSNTVRPRVVLNTMIGVVTLTAMTSCPGAACARLR
jgi:hypothetical protein